MSLYSRPEEFKRGDIDALLEEVLGEKAHQITPRHFTIKENLEEGTSEVSCSFMEGQKKRKFNSKGIGFVDALFKGILEVYVKMFRSLKNVCFTSFGLRAQLESGSSLAGSDSEATVLLETSNRGDRVMAFRRTAKSINAAAAQVVFDAIQFYINCEMAFKKLKAAILDAKKRGRNDTAAVYTSKLVDIVNIASCEECE
jgi:hypothetical protein